MSHCDFINGMIKVAELINEPSKPATTLRPVEFHICHAGRLMFTILERENLTRLQRLGFTSGQLQAYIRKGRQKSTSAGPWSIHRKHSILFTNKLKNHV